MKLYRRPLQKTVLPALLALFFGALLAPNNGHARSKNKRKAVAKAKKTKKTNKTQRRPAKSARRKRARRSRRDLWPPMTLLSANSRELIKVRIYDRRGRTDRNGLKRLRHFMRCLRTQRSVRIDWRLVKLLYRVSRDFPKRKLIVYSGFRSRRYARTSRSNHIKGKAVDFRVQGISNRQLRDHLRRKYSRVGVGYYPNSLFVHLDVRKKKSAFWVDMSAPGKRPKYVDAYAVLKAERKALAKKPKKRARNKALARASTTTKSKARTQAKVAKAKVETVTRPEIPLQKPAVLPPRVVIGPLPVGPSPIDAAPSDLRHAPPLR